MQTYPTLAEFEERLNSLPTEEQQWPEAVSLADDGGEPWEFLTDIAVGLYRRGESLMRVTWVDGTYSAERRG